MALLRRASGSGRAGIVLGFLFVIHPSIFLMPPGQLTKEPVRIDHGGMLVVLDSLGNLVTCFQQCPM